MHEVVLYQKGSHITDISIKYKGRICIMSGGAGGEHCTYIERESEPDLLRALQNAKKNWFQKLLPAKKTVDLKTEIIQLITEKFQSDVKDPSSEMDTFF